MRFIADFHIHSHFSIATSKKLIPEYLDYFAKIKGITVVGTGDCVHPGWCNELKEKLEPAGNGLFRLKSSYKLNDPSLPDLSDALDKDVYFILTAEISSIYKKHGRVRKVHNLCVFPTFEAVEALQAKLARVGNIASDGRPILGLDAKILLEMQLETDPQSFLIPAHIWTPWFSVLGSKSGFDTIDECFEELTQHIFAVETGLSSDPPMNWACSFLDSFQLISNSDAHSPEKLGREANIFDTDISYDAIVRALRDDEGFLGTIEFFPQEGKYHYDGHRKCNICWDPLETIRHDGICSVCGKPVTRGVMYRVAELADRPIDTITNDKKDFFSITSLPDLVSEILGKRTVSKAVQAEYFHLLRTLGSDFDILLNCEIDQVKKAGGELFAEGIRRLRNRHVHIQDGYDGEFGRITVFDPSELKSFSTQSFLFSSSSTTPTTPPQTYQSLTFDINQFKRLQKSDDNFDTLDNAKPNQSENIAQQQGIEHGEGVCMVLAGPGTGKTRVLTERIAYLIKHQGIDPSSILAVTFSNKAAQEMKERLDKLIPKQPVSVMTFHALGLSILNNHCQHFGRTVPFTLMGREEATDLLTDALTLSKTHIKSIMQAIEADKQGIPHEPLEKHYQHQYETLLQKENAFDLNDLLSLPVQLMREQADILEQLRTTYRWILIDEYQDINPRQYEMITLMGRYRQPEFVCNRRPESGNLWIPRG